MKKRIIALVLLVVGVLQWGCGEAQSENELVLGTSLDYPPFEFSNNGEAMGFDIELARAVAKKMGKDLRVMDLDFGTLIPALKTGKIDVIMAGLSPNEQRRKNVDFSDPYYAPEEMAFISRKGAVIKGLNELRGKAVGTQLGSFTEAFLREHEQEVPGMKIVTLAKNPNLIQELKVGRIDAVLITKAQAVKFTQKNEELEFNLIPFKEEGVAAAFKKGSELVGPFNEALSQLKDEGYIEQLNKKWLEDVQ